MLPLVLILAGVLLLFGSQTVLAKSGVNWGGVGGPIHYAIGVAEQVYWQIAGAQVVVTSLNDSHEHNPASLHHRGQAVDLRTRTLSGAQVVAVVAELKARLYSIGFDVVLESDHIHIEYDPKLGRVFPYGVAA